MRALVYALCCRTSQRIYVGKTVRLKKRLWQHKYNAEHGKNSHLCNAIRRYGWNNFIVAILAQGVTEEEAFRLEREWIADLDLQNPANGYNETAGGDGLLNWRPSGESRSRMSEAQLRLLTDPATRSVTIAARRRGGLSRRGRKHSDTSLAKMVESQQHRNQREMEDARNSCP